MKKIITLILILASFSGYSQTVGQFRYDTTKFLKVGGRNQVVIDSVLTIGDTTLNKPLTINTAGQIKKLPYWPAGTGGGGSGTVTINSENKNPDTEQVFPCLGKYFLVFAD